MWNRRTLIGAIGIGALIGFAGPAAAQETYIPLISKGFQHQFWQAVKAGAEQAAKDYNVRITFEGPDSETMVDKQIDMLSAALAKNPKAIGFAALDSQAAIPLLRKAQAAKIPVTTVCHSWATERIRRPLVSTLMISAPMIVPRMVPRPPLRDVPPMTTAAMASSS